MPLDLLGQEILGQEITQQLNLGKPEEFVNGTQIHETENGVLITDKEHPVTATVQKEDGYAVFVMQPRRPGFGLGVPVAEAAVAHLMPSLKNTTTIMRAEARSSLLTYGFNKMWATMLTCIHRDKLKIDYAGMVHDDIGAPMGWADVMIPDMETMGIELLSAVIPIKDKRGLTSTALESGDPWAPTRLTLKEIFDRDPTFTDAKILVNTGLWLCKANVYWTSNVLFQQQDQIIRYPDGTFVARTIPEDWDFSRKVKGQGGTIYATRKVQLYHEYFDFHNKSVWGEWETDQGDVVAQVNKETPTLEVKGL